MINFRDSIDENLQKGLKEVPWNQTIEKGDKIVTNSYIASIIKDFNLMHKAMAPILHPKLHDDIFDEVLNRLMKRLDDFYNAVPNQSKYAPKRIKVDLKYFEKNI